MPFREDEEVENDEVDEIAAGVDTQEHSLCNSGVLQFGNPSPPVSSPFPSASLPPSSPNTDTSTHPFLSSECERLFALMCDRLAVGQVKAKDNSNNKKKRMS